MEGSVNNAVMPAPTKEAVDARLASDWAHFKVSAEILSTLYAEIDSINDSFNKIRNKNKYASDVDAYLTAVDLPTATFMKLTNILSPIGSESIQEAMDNLEKFEIMNRLLDEQLADLRVKFQAIQSDIRQEFPNA